MPVFMGEILSSEGSGSCHCTELRPRNVDEFAYYFVWPQENEMKKYEGSSRSTTATDIDKYPMCHYVHYDR